MGGVYCLIMGIDATSLGVQIFFNILLPGFMFFVSFRWVSGFHEKQGEFASFCAAAFFGLMLLLFLQSSNSNIQITKLLSNPLPAGAILSFVGLIMGSIIGIPVKIYKFFR